MSNQNLDTIRWFVDKIKEKPGTYIWLASSGGIITGQPITPNEYFQTLFRNPKLSALPDSEEVLALKDVKINFKYPDVHNFHVALVDRNLIVARGAYDPNTSYSEQTTQ